MIGVKQNVIHVLDICVLLVVDVSHSVLCLDGFVGDISAFLRMLSHVWDSSALWRATKQGDLPSGTSDIIRFVWLGRKNSLDF